MLARWRCGRVRARSCALTAGSPMRANGLKRHEPTVRQPRRAWYEDTPRRGWVVSWGRGHHWPWPWMPRPWGTAWSSWPCASSSAGGRCPGRGSSCPRGPRGLSGGQGAGCCGGGTGRSHTAGRCSSGRIGAWRLPGCCDGARGEGGLPVCGSPRRAVFAPPVPRVGVPHGTPHAARATHENLGGCLTPRGRAFSEDKTTLSPLTEGGALRGCTITRSMGPSGQRVPT